MEPLAPPHPLKITQEQLGHHVLLSSVIPPPPTVLSEDPLSAWISLYTLITKTLIHPIQQLLVKTGVSEPTMLTPIILDVMNISRRVAQLRSFRAQ